MSYPNLNLSWQLNETALETPEKLLETVLPAIVQSLQGAKGAAMYRLVRGGLTRWARSDEHIAPAEILDEASKAMEALQVYSIRVEDDTPYRMYMPIHRINVQAVMLVEFEAKPDEMTYSLVDALGQQIGLLLENQDLQYLLQRQVLTTSALADAKSLLDIVVVLAKYMVTKGQFVSLNYLSRNSEGKVTGAHIIATANRRDSYEVNEPIGLKLDSLRKVYDILQEKGELQAETELEDNLFLEEDLAWLRANKIRSQYLLPIRQQGQIQAFISIIDTGQNIILTQREKDVYKSLVGQAGVIIERQNLLKQAQSNLQSAQTLYQLTSELVAVDDVPDILRVLGRYVGDDVRAVSLTEVDYDAKLEMLHKYITRYMLQDGEIKTPNLMLHETLEAAEARAIIRHWQKFEDQLEVVPDVKDETVDLPRRDLLIEQKVGSYITIPLQENGKRTRNLNITWHDARQFSDDFIRLIQTAKTQITLVLSNRQLLAQTRAVAQQAGEEARVLRLLNELNSEEDALDERALLQRAVRVLHEATGVDHVGIATLDQSTQHSIVVAEYPAANNVYNEVAASDSDTIAQLLQTRKQALIVRDVAANTEIASEIRDELLGVGIAAAAFLPMFDNNRKLLGTVGLDMYAPGDHFSAADVRLAQTIVNQVSVSLQRIRLFRSTQRQARQLRQITEFGQFAQASLQVQDILATTLRFNQSILPGDYFVIMLYDVQVGALRMVARYRDGESDVMLPGKIVDRDINTVAQQAWDEKTIIHINNIQADWEWKHPVDSVLRTLISAPLVVRGQVLGIVEVGNYQPNAYTQTDLTVLRQMVNQIAVTLANAEAYKQSQQQARNKVLANEIIADLQQQTSIQGILQTTIEELGQALGAKRARIRISAQLPEQAGSES